MPEDDREGGKGCADEEPSSQGSQSGIVTGLSSQQAESARSLWFRDNAVMFAAIVSALGALGALISAVSTAVALHFTDKQLDLSNNGQITERYTAAVAELGNSSTDVRLGGIYALSRLGRDSANDRPTVIDVLAAYTRDHVADSYSTACGGMAATSGHNPPQVILPNDVRAALQVLGGLNLVEPGSSTTRNLSRVCLPRTAILEGATFTGFDLTDSNLSSAYLNDAVLDSASLRHVNLKDSHLFSVKLERSALNSADLAGADLTAADLAGSDLTGANLTGANLTGANLTGANLTGANLTGANIEGAVGIDPSGSAGHPR